ERVGVRVRYSSASLSAAMPWRRSFSQRFLREIPRISAAFIFLPLDCANARTFPGNAYCDSTAQARGDTVDAVFPGGVNLFKKYCNNRGKSPRRSRSGGISMS